MANIAGITGLQNVLRNIKAREASMAAGVSTGLRIAGLRLQRESQLKVPVNFGVLKNSAYTRVSGTGWATEVHVGYTAAYALYVHESVGMVLQGQDRQGFRAKGKYWDPQGRAQAKFLEEPARTLGPELRAIIRSHSKLPGII